MAWTCSPQVSVGDTDDGYLLDRIVFGEGRLDFGRVHVLSRPTRSCP